MVDESISSIQRGNTLVDGTAKQLDEIVIGSAEVSNLAEEVATAGREQTQGLEQISLGLTQIDQVTQSNTASAEESASASEELSSQAQQVKSMLARFKLKNGRKVLADLQPNRSDSHKPVRAMQTLRCLWQPQHRSPRGLQYVRPRLSLSTTATSENSDLGRTVMSETRKAGLQDEFIDDDEENEDTQANKYLFFKIDKESYASASGTSSK